MVIGYCPYCRRNDRHLREMIVVTDCPLTDNVYPVNGAPLAEAPHVLYCWDCIDEIQEDPILFTLKPADEIG